MTEPVDLDEAARGVIAAGREGIAPNDFVAARLRRSVDRALQASVPPPRSGRRTAALLVALGAAVLGGALYASQLAETSGEPDTESKRAPAAPAVPVPPRAAVPAPAPEPAPEASGHAVAPPPAQAPSAGRSEAPRPSRSQQLGAEIELLSRVNAAVNGGDGGRALALLDEYDRKFRPSILAEERAAAAVLALCAAGRSSEARAAADRFEQKWKRSPLLGRISGSCAGKR